MVLDDSTLTARPLCDCGFRGGSWNRDGVILLAPPRTFARASGVYRPRRYRVAVTKVDASRGEQDVLLPSCRTDAGFS